MRFSFVDAIFAALLGVALLGVVATVPPLIDKWHEVKQQVSIQVRPAELKEANAFVATQHRHHKPVVGHRFSIRAVKDGNTVGVAIVGRPVARMCDQRSTLEVTRLCTDGTKNACSVLYAAAARVGKELGYERIQTYILDSEPGTSLLAAGWVCEGEAGGGQWKRSDGKPNRTDQPTCPKQRWAKVLNTTPTDSVQGKR